MAGALSTLIAILLATPATADAPPVPPAPAVPQVPAPAPAAPPNGPLTDADPPIVLSWTAPDECPGQEELRAEIRRLAGTVPAPAELPEVHATVRRGPKESWQLTLATRAGALYGERKLSAPDCASLMRAAALVMALMINPSAGALLPPPPPAPPPPPPPPVVVLPAPAPTRPPPGPFAAGADVLIGTGMLPGRATPGVGLRLRLAGARLAAELRGNLWMDRSATSSFDPSAGGSFELVDFALAGCVGAHRERRVVPGVCAGGALLRAHGSGFGVTDPAEAIAWWPGAFVEGNVRVRLTLRNAVRAAVEALVPLGRPTFALGGIGSVFRPAAFGARGTLGWELNF